MSHHKTTKKGPIYGEFNFAKGGSVYVKGYVRGGKVEKVMHEFKEGDLHSGSKSGPVVQNRKQAVAIAMSEAGKTKKMNHGGLVHEDAKQDKTLIKKAIRQHDVNLHGGAKDPIKLKHGGKAK